MCINYYWITFHCMVVPQFTIHWGISWLLPSFGTMAKPALCIVLCGYTLSVHWGSSLRAWFAGSHSKGIFSFIENCLLKWLYRIAFPPTVGESSCCSMFVSIWCCQCFGFCRSSRYAVIVYCCFFHLQFSNDIWWISSYSFNSVFCWTEILNFSQVQITQCFFHGLYFGVGFNTSLPNPRSVSPVLPSMCFITVLYLGSLSILRKYLWKVRGLCLDHVFCFVFPVLCSL